MVFANSGNTLNKRKNGPLEQIVSSISRFRRTRVSFVALVTIFTVALDSFLKTKKVEEIREPNAEISKRSRRLSKWFVSLFEASFACTFALC